MKKSRARSSASRDETPPSEEAPQLGAGGGKSMRVYRYGLLAPTEGAEVVREQMRLACAYRNELTAIERGRRAAARALMLDQPDVVRLEAAVAEAEGEVVAALAILKKQRAKTRSASDTADQREAWKAAKVKKKSAVTALLERRRAAREDESLIEASRGLCSKAAELHRSARHYSGLYWGAGALVDAAMEAARKAPLYKGGQPKDPKFLRYDGTGQVGVQVHKSGVGKHGFSVEEVMAGVSDWFAIKSRPALSEPETAPQVGVATSLKLAAHRARNAARRQAALAAGGGDQSLRAELAVRVGTAPDRSPVVARWPMVMHRPLPAGAVVKRVAVSLRRVGPREEWSTEITIDASACARPESTGDGTVAVELGWLQVPFGLRVASTLSATAEHGGLLLDARRVGGWRRSESLRSTRDKSFNEARTAVVAWLRASGMPEWMRLLTVRRGEVAPTEPQALAHLSQWRSPGRLAGLALQWRERRWEGDGEGYDALEAWRYHDHHLWEWESSQRKKSLRSRKDLYRVFAARLAKRYARVLVSDVDLREIAKRPEVELVNERSASNRQVASVSELRLAIRQACASHGAEYVEVRAAGLSSTCPSCGSELVEAAAAEEHSAGCLECPYANDTDSTALLNALRRAGCDSEVDAMIARGRSIGAALRAGQEGRADDDDQAAE